MTRRSAFQTIAGAVAALPAGSVAPASAGRLKQSLCRWCYSRIPLDGLCRQAAEMGLSGIDLAEPDEWPTVRKCGLVSPGSGGATNWMALSYSPDTGMFFQNVISAWALPEKK
jgi:hydroxypyruvate isomerase